MSHGFPELAAMWRGFFQENGWWVGAVGKVGGTGNHGLQDRGHGLAHFGQVVGSGRIFLRFSSCTPLYSPMDCGKTRWASSWSMALVSLVARNPNARSRA